MDFIKLRKQFPVTEKYVYLNHAGVAPIPLAVKHKIDLFLQQYMEQGFIAGPEWIKEIQKARTHCATLLNACSPDEIAFTSSTSHGLSLVANGLNWKKGDAILIPDCEFPSNVYPWLHLQHKGVEVKQIPFQDGRLSFEALEKCADKHTRLLSISSVQYGSGWRAPLEKLGAWCRARNILFCVDAIQSLGILPMDVQKYQIDFLAADGHKWLLAPEGTALFYCSKRIWDQITPSLIGWKSVQNPLDFDHIHYQLREGAQKFEPGSFNALGIHALNASLEMLLEIGIDVIEKQIFTLTTACVQLIKEKWPKAKLISSLQEGERSGILAVKTPLAPEILVETLLKKHIYLSSRRGWLRFSPHCYNTEKELEFAVTEASQIS